MFRQIVITSSILYFLVFVLTDVADTVAYVQNPLQTPIVGTVKDKSGVAIPNASVRVKNLTTGSEIETTTNDEGEFRLPNLSPGQYEVTVNLPGFKSTTQIIEVNFGQATSLSFVIEAGEVPDGVVQPPSTPPTRPAPPPSRSTTPPTSPESPRSTTSEPSQRGETGNTFEASEKVFDNDLKLRTWLEEKATQKKVLHRIVQLADKTSIFVFQQNRTRKKVEYQVNLVDVRLSSSDLLARINQERNKTFVGVHRIADSSSLVVFYALR